MVSFPEVDIKDPIKIHFLEFLSNKGATISSASKKIKRHPSTIRRWRKLDKHFDYAIKMIQDIHNNKREQHNSFNSIHKPLDPVFVQEYVTSFIDLLGTSNRLYDLETSHLSGIESKIVESMRYCVHPVLYFRMSLQAMFESFISKELPLYLSKKKFPKEFENFLPRFTQTRIITQGFSDSVVLSVPFGVEFAPTHYPIHSVFELLHGLALIYPDLLLKGIYARGAIEIGSGVELYSGEVYSSSLSRAYELESKIAIFPRIVIGNRLEEFLRENAQNEHPSLEGSMRRVLGEACLDIVSSDEDGNLYLDYLSPKILKAFNLNTDILNTIFQLIQRDEKLEMKKGNEKVANKLNKLACYFSERIN